MKKTIFFFALIQLTIANVYSQQIDQDSLELIELESSKSKVVEKELIFEVVEQMPEYPGGSKMLEFFFQSNINSNYKNFEIYKGKSIIVSFIVEKDGTLSDIEILRGIDKNINEEIIRVIKRMPLWLAGKQNDKTVRVRFSLLLSL